MGTLEHVGKYLLKHVTCVFIWKALDMDTFVTSAEEIPIPMNVSPDGLTSHEGSLGDR